MLGYAEQHPYYLQARRALQKLLVGKPDEAYCQPCFSPVWDTALSALVLQEEGSTQSLVAARNCFKLVNAKTNFAMARPIGVIIIQIWLQVVGRLSIVIVFILI